jgi:glutaredoxin
MTQIKIYGTKWCGDTKRALRIFTEREVPYEWIDIDKDPEGEKLVKATNRGNRSVPTIFFPDGTVLVEPGNQELNEKLDSLI